MVLAGGSTPRGVYAVLAHEFRQQFPWKNTHFFWSDERHVPPDHADSNYRMAWDTMLSPVTVPQANIHRIRAELADPAQAAREYSSHIRKWFGALEGKYPRFDLVLLGLGSDAHTASLFPGTSALGAAESLVVANWVEKVNSFRITMSVPLLNQASRTFFTVQGPEKAHALHAVLQGGFHPKEFPAQLIRPVNGEVLWLADREAASLCSVV